MDFMASDVVSVICSTFRSPLPPFPVWLSRDGANVLKEDVREH